MLRLWVKISRNRDQCVDFHVYEPLENLRKETPEKILQKFEASSKIMATGIAHN